MCISFLTTVLMILVVYTGNYDFSFCKRVQSFLTPSSSGDLDERSFMIFLKMFNIIFLWYTMCFRKFLYWEWPFPFTCLYIFITLCNYHHTFLVLDYIYCVTQFIHFNIKTNTKFNLTRVELYLTIIIF